MSDLAQDTRPGASSLGLVAIKDGQQRLPDLAGLLAGVNGLPDAGVLVVADDGRRLLVVGLEALAEGLGVVVGALDEGLASDVVLHGLLGGVEGQVVRTAGGGVDETARDARDEQGVVDLELHRVLQGEVALAEHGVETLGLGNGAGEAVEDEAVGGERVVRNNYKTAGKKHGRGDTYPPWHSLLFSNSSLIMPMTMSSLTRPPSFMIFLACLPRAVPLATWARSMSPVAYGARCAHWLAIRPIWSVVLGWREDTNWLLLRTAEGELTRWQQLNFSLILGAWVPLPAPGGPMRIMRTCSAVVVGLPENSRASRDLTRPSREAMTSPRRLTSSSMKPILNCGGGVLLGEEWRCLVGGARSEVDEGSKQEGRGKEKQNRKKGKLEKEMTSKSNQRSETDTGRGSWQGSRATGTSFSSPGSR